MLATLPSADTVGVVMHNFRKFGLGDSHFSSKEPKFFAAYSGSMVYDCARNRSMESGNVRNGYDGIAVIVNTG